MRSILQDRFLTSIGWGSGGSTLLLGLVVIFGWYTGNSTLTKVNPAFVQMQFNTAFGFVLCGAGLLCFCSSKDRWAAVLGSLAALIGFLTLVEYIGAIDLGIDEIFIKHPHDPLTSHPGRMAPNTALCFFLSGAALLLGRFRSEHLPIGSLPALLSGLAFGLGTVAFYGYLTNVETAYGWGKLTRMAVHTAGGFYKGLSVSSPQRREGDLFLG